MKRLLPGWTELAFLTGLALVCAAAVMLVPRRDVGLMVGGTPLFLIGSLMGFRRNLQLLEADEAARSGAVAGGDDVSCDSAA